MKQVYVWKKNPPPINSWVWASYEIEEQHAKWQLLKTCKRGCCVSSSIGNMVLPHLWYLATQEQGQEEQNKWDTLEDIDMFDLYSE